MLALRRLLDSAPIPRTHKSVMHKWPLRQCTICQEMKPNLFGPQACDDCRASLDALEDGSENSSLFDNQDMISDCQNDSDYNWTSQHITRANLPRMAPARREERFYWPNGALCTTYIQPVPVSGFPYSYNDPDFAYVRSTSASRYRPVDDRLWIYPANLTCRLDALLCPHLLNCDSFRVAHAAQWDRIVHRNARDNAFSREQLVRAWHLLFRDPFLWEQPKLGLLMVHPKANKDRYVQTTAQQMTQLVGQVLYPTVLNLVLHFAYEDSAHHILPDCSFSSRKRKHTATQQRICFPAAQPARKTHRLK
jgi:hypothetical protein